MAPTPIVRAGIFIGVDKSGDLQRLNDAATSAERMHAWALKQGMADRTHAILITDSGGKKVNIDSIYDSIKALIDGPGIQQLIVYFAGHGINIHRSEQWLLTEAPVRTSAAVDVAGNVVLARYCGIPHVVFISDACRVAPEGIQAQNVRGSDIFPNDLPNSQSRPVDQFFACSLGKTAAETKDPKIAAGNYRAIYTDALLDGLLGEVPTIIEDRTDNADPYYYIKPRKLADYVEKEVPRRVISLNLQHEFNQNPDAIILDHPNWVSRIREPSPFTEGIPVIAPGPTPPGNLRTMSQALLRAADRTHTVLDEQLEVVESVGLPGGQELASTVRQLATPFGPDHFESECGIKVRGARIVDFFAVRAQVEPLGDQTLRISVKGVAAAAVLLRFENNVGTVIPAIPGFIAGLTFDDGELVDVAYEPSTNSSRWVRYHENLDEIRRLRAVAASSSQHGRFHLDQPDADRIARRMQSNKGLDLTLSVYAAYAFHDLQEIDRIREMSMYQQDDTRIMFFDLALLGRRLVDRSVEPSAGIVPFTPLLAQGWSLIRANRVKLYPELDGLEGTMQDSLWSLYDSSGLERLTRAIKDREL